MQLQCIADALDLVVHGKSDLDITSLAPVSSASSNQLTFVVSLKYSRALQSTSAAAVIVPENMASLAPCSYLVSANPYLSYAAASQLMYPDHRGPEGIADSAIVADDVVVASGAGIGERVVVESGARIGENTWIGPGCHIGSNVTIGARCYLHANATVCHECVLGDDCRIQSGAVVGSDGFGYARNNDGWTRIQQVGRVLVGSNVDIGANTTIDRGALDDTVIGDGVILDNQIQIAHNVHIGKHTAIAACVGIAGSTSIGETVRLAGKQLSSDI